MNHTQRGRGGKNGLSMERVAWLEDSVEIKVTSSGLSGHNKSSPEGVYCSFLQVRD